MSQFFYEAKTQAGQLIDGTIDAPSAEQAVTILQQKNLLILNLTRADKKFGQIDIFGFLRRPSAKDLVVFTRQLATLIDADVPLVNGLHILAAQSEKASFRVVLNGLVRSIEGGASLSIALSEYPKVFGDFYVNLVRAGELAGQLQQTLLHLADYLERSANLNSKIKGALAYPAFVLFAVIVVAVIMVTTVLPQLLSIIKDSGVTDLPITTRLLLGVTDFVNSNIILILVAIIAVVGGLIYFMRTPQGKKSFDNFMIHVPQFGRVARNFYIARFAETFSTLIKAGVPILEGLSVTGDVVGNEVYKKIILEARDNVRNGGTISEVFSQYSEMPTLVSSMIAIGEKTGKTDYILENIFKFYKNEADNDVQNLSQLIEPVMILGLGVAVGVLVSAILLPIYSIVGSAG